MGYRDYSVAKGHIVDSTGHGDFTTIASALSAAVSGQTIFIRPGTYTENITLKAGVDLAAFICEALTPNVTIVGKMTMSFTGTVSISGIRFQTNSDYFLQTSGANSGTLNISNCYLNCTNNTGINITNANASVTIYSSVGDLGTTGIALFAVTNGSLNFFLFNCTNSGSSITANTISAGSGNYMYCNSIPNPTTTSGTASWGIYYSKIGLPSLNATGFTVGGSGAHGIEYSDVYGGTSSALVISGTCYVTHINVNSSNANAITGAGTMFYVYIAFTGSSSGHNVTTETALATLI